MKKAITVILILFLSIYANAKTYTLTSPDGKIEVKVETGTLVTYAVTMDGETVISPSAISMELDNGLKMGEQVKVRKVLRRSVDEMLTPVVARKYNRIRDHYNEMTLQFKGKYSLIFRAYDDGVAWRWATGLKGTVIVANEQAVFNFPEDHYIWFPEEESMHSHQEREYKYIHLSAITPSRFCSTGTLVDLGKGKKVYISEADLHDYPGMFLMGIKENPYGLKGKFAAYPLETEQTNDRNVIVTKYAPYLAKTSGNRTFPWRVVIITREDKDLVQTEMIWKLARPLELKDVSWIKPGKVAWDWWNALNVYGVDFKSGVNTDTYKYFIDFAHDYGLEYIILDEGWYELDDVLKIRENVDLPAILRHAKEKNVGVILWVTWKALDDQLDKALEQFEQWGVKGIKVDFMQRDDQWMVDYYWRIARKAAEHHLLVDYHGAYKPTGLRRAYPNVITREGVAGLEQDKWGEKANPEHDVTLPFIRMVAGPMDYTPGAMINATKKNFRPVWDKPMSQGTRCHQLAMYVIYESPLQMLADSPSNYMKEIDAMDFLTPVPTVWDTTLVLDAKVSDYILMARKTGNKWYLGAMTDWDARNLKVDFGFLPDGNYTLEIWQDGINADRYASDYKRITKAVSKNTKLDIHLAPGGGWVGVIVLK